MTFGDDDADDGADDGDDDAGGGDERARGPNWANGVAAVAGWQRRGWPMRGREGEGEEWRERASVSVRD